MKHHNLCLVYEGPCCPWMGDCSCQCNCDIISEVVDHTMNTVLATVDDYLEEIHSPHDKNSTCIRCDYVAVIAVLRDRITTMSDRGK